MHRKKSFKSKLQPVNRMLGVLYGERDTYGKPSSIESRQVYILKELARSWYFELLWSVYKKDRKAPKR